jgi:hypothetical protein
LKIAGFVCAGDSSLKVSLSQSFVADKLAELRGMESALKACARVVARFHMQAAFQRAYAASI